MTDSTIGHATFTELFIIGRDTYRYIVPLDGMEMLVAPVE